MEALCRVLKLQDRVSLQAGHSKIDVPVPDTALVEVVSMLIKLLGGPNKSQTQL